MDNHSDLCKSAENFVILMTQSLQYTFFVSCLFFESHFEEEAKAYVANFFLLLSNWAISVWTFWVNTKKEEDSDVLVTNPCNPNMKIGTAKTWSC